MYPGQITDNISLPFLLPPAATYPSVPLWSEEEMRGIKALAIGRENRFRDQPDRMKMMR